MSAYLITGSSGAGKTSVAEELKHRGFTAYSTDEMPDITRLYDLTTGLPVDQWPAAPLDTQRYAWNWDPKALRQLITSPKPVFVCAITSNTKENAHLFDGVFVIYPKPETLRHRLLTRTNNHMGKHPADLAQILDRHHHNVTYWRQNGATIIDGNQPLNAVVDDILQHLSPKELTP